MNVRSGRKAHVVEIDAAGLTWIKSSASDTGTGGCVELAWTTSGILIRCSRDRSGERLSLAPTTFVRLITLIRPAS